MAQASLAKSASISNLNSSQHIKLYQKVLYTGSQMAATLDHYHRHKGAKAARSALAKKWYDLMDSLTEVLL